LPTSTGLLIADSSPLIALAKLSLLDLPSRLYGRVAMPDIVYQECTDKPGLPDSIAIKAAVSNGVIKVMPAAAWPTSILQPRLNAGELAAIALSLESKASLLIDELRGRHAAMQLGIPVIGVCGLLLAAKQRSWVDALAPHLELLQESGYFISASLRRSVLIAAGELSN
jgi:predicted nucleic acid-binding protein